MIAIVTTDVPPSLDDDGEAGLPAGVAAARASCVACGVGDAEALRAARPTEARQAFSMPSWSNP